MKKMTAALLYGAKMHEAEAGGAGSEAGAAEGENTDGGEQPVGFDDFLKQGDNQSIFDKRIAKALDTARTKWEAEYKKQLEDAKTEAEKLAKMTADQKAKYEFEKKTQDLAAREAELNKRELKATAIGQLQEKGLPTELADMLDYSNAEACNASIEKVNALFATALEKAVNERLKGAGAARGASGTYAPTHKFTREEISKMSAEEINANYEAIKASLK